ncbi:hypothetical protein C8R48DRAFT_720704 [Suillus tomentosus]|nr:hypothetical protein C8R48DRAFT_720704 [Suillus tomentosus]
MSFCRICSVHLPPSHHSSIRGSKVELIDIRMVLLWDIYTVGESMRKAKSCVIVHKAGMTSGIGERMPLILGRVLV